MRAEIIAVGSELLLGQIVNTNARFLSEKLAELGVNIYFHTVVGDNWGRMLAALETATGRADLIILTGGLGPTDDDLTKEALAAFLQQELVIDEGELQKLRDFVARRKIPWVEKNTKQAAFLPGCHILNNEVGTAPGMAVRCEKGYFVVLPGPPHEMERMFVKYATPWLMENYIEKGTLPIRSKVLKFVGISEPKIEETLQDLFSNQQEPTLALLAKTGEVHLRITARAADEAGFEMLVRPVLEEIMKRIGEHLVASDNQTISELLAGILEKTDLTVSTAESCTGGLLSAALTGVPGSSRFFAGGVVAYSNQVKENLLGVPESMLALHGAVSSQVALAMAQGVKKLSGSQIGIGITGIAGPGGGTGDKPVGLVYIALHAPGLEEAQQFQFSGERETIRQRSVVMAQYLLKRCLLQLGYE